jgi:endonuclease-3
MQLVSKKDWGIFPHLLVSHGRAICTARKPKCATCPLKDICPSAFKVG